MASAGIYKMGMGNNVKKITYHGKVTDLNKLDQFYTTKNTKKGKGDKIYTNICINTQQNNKYTYNQ